MTASRGDRKPCTAPNCVGTMQFGRRSDNDAQTHVARAGRPHDVRIDDTGWRCDTDPAHFRADGRSPAITATT
jgi:hypothetical protein